jgi:large subunit ribosomal protein L23
VKNVHEIIVAPHITERSVALSYGDPKVKEEKDLVRKYTFIVAKSANKIEIKQAIEAIYNAGKKKGEAIVVENVRTVRVLGKKRRRGQRSTGYEPDRKKAIITLAKGQMLEDYGV